MTNTEYERHEFDRFLADQKAIETSPLQDRKDGQERLFNDVVESPEWVAEKAEWVLNGSYGYGVAMQAAKIQANPRMNRRAALFQIVAVFEYRTSQALARASYLKLAGEQQDRLNDLFDEALETEAVA